MTVTVKVRSRSPGGGAGLGVLDILAMANDCRLGALPAEGALGGAHVGLWLPARIIQEGRRG